MTAFDLSDLLEAGAARHPERACLGWGEGRSATYAEVAAAVAAQAEALVDSGLAGRPIGLMCRNRPELVVLWLACMRAGALAVFLNPQFTAQEVGGVIEDLELELVFADPEVADATPRSVALDERARLDPIEPGLPSSGPSAAPQREIGAVVLTSGSTGRPKYVAVPRSAYVLKGLLNAQLLGWGPADRAYGVMPLFHVGAQCETLAPAFAAGARVDLVESFSATELWADLERLGTTHLHATGSLLAMAIARGAPAAELELRRIVASLRHDLVEALAPLAPGADLISLYGLTECPLGTLSMPGEPYRPGWVGHPYAGWRGIRLTVEGAIVAPGEEGEIELRNPACTPGYLGTHPEDPFTGDGWLRTGDLGRVADGGLYLTGRLKEMIRRSGENIAPTQVEEAALRHPGVVEAAAVGHPDPVRDEEVRLFIEVGGDGPAPAELREFVASVLARYKLPRYVDVVAAMPRTASGKVDKPALARSRPDPQWDCEQPAERSALDTGAYADLGSTDRLDA